MVGGMLLVCGGYTSTGATKSFYAWGCNTAEAEAPADHAFGVPPGQQEQRISAVPLMLLTCPSHAHIEAHASIALASLGSVLLGAQVIGVSMADSGAAESSAEVADSQEQALSLLLQRLQQLQLQRVSGAASLVSRARLVAAVQPCRYKLMAAGHPSHFRTYWVGLLDLETNKRKVGSGQSVEVCK